MGPRIIFTCENERGDSIAAALLQLHSFIWSLTSLLQLVQSTTLAFMLDLLFTYSQKRCSNFQFLRRKLLYSNIASSLLLLFQDQSHLLIHWCAQILCRLQDCKAKLINDKKIALVAGLSIEKDQLFIRVVQSPIPVYISTCLAAVLLLSITYHVRNVPELACHVNFDFFFEWNRRGSSETRSESVERVCKWALLVKYVSKLYLQVDLICQTDIWSVIDRSRVRFPFFSLFWLGSSSVPLEFSKLANAQPSNFGPLRTFCTEMRIMHVRNGLISFVFFQYCEESPLELPTCSFEDEGPSYTSLQYYDKWTREKMLLKDDIRCLCPEKYNYLDTRYKFMAKGHYDIVVTNYYCLPVSFNFSLYFGTKIVILFFSWWIATLARFAKKSRIYPVNFSSTPNVFALSKCLVPA